MPPGSKVLWSSAIWAAQSSQHVSIQTPSSPLDPPPTMESLMSTPGLFLLDFTSSPLSSSTEASDEAWDCTAVDYDLVRNLRYGLFQLLLEKESATIQSLLPYLSDYSESTIESQLRLCVSSGLLMQTVECCDGEATVVYEDYMLNFGKRKRSIKVDCPKRACQAIRMCLDELGQALSVAEIGRYVKWTFDVNIEGQLFTTIFVRTMLEKLVQENLVAVSKGMEDDEPRFCAVEQQLKQPSTPEKKSFNVRDFLDQKMFVPEDSDEEDEVDPKEEYEAAPPCNLPSRLSSVLSDDTSSSEVKPLDLREMKERVLPKFNLVSLRNDAFRFSPEESLSPPTPTAEAEDSSISDIHLPIRTPAQTSRPCEAKIKKKKRSPSTAQLPDKVPAVKKRTRKPKQKEVPLPPVPVEVVEPLVAKPGLAFRRSKLDSL